MQAALDAWVEAPKEINYTVVKGDCLWNIAKKSDIYSNPFAWPNIYKANRDQIKNPNLIFPGQVLKIPTLTDAQKKEAEMNAKKYRRHRTVKKDEMKKDEMKKDEKKDMKKKDEKK